MCRSGTMPKHEPSSSSLSLSSTNEKAPLVLSTCFVTAQLSLAPMVAVASLSLSLMEFPPLLALRSKQPSDASPPPVAAAAGVAAGAGAPPTRSTYCGLVIHVLSEEPKSDCDAKNLTPRLAPQLITVPIWPMMRDGIDWLSMPGSAFTLSPTLKAPPPPPPPNKAGFAGAGEDAKGLTGVPKSPALAAGAAAKSPAPAAGTGAAPPKVVAAAHACWAASVSGDFGGTGGSGRIGK